MRPYRLLAAVAAVVVLSSALVAATASAQGAPPPPPNVTVAAEAIRSVISMLLREGYSWGQAAQLFHNLSLCLPGTGLGEAAAEAASALSSHNVSAASRDLARFLDALATSPLEHAAAASTCPAGELARLVYGAVLASLYTPTPLGLVPPPHAPPPGLSAGPCATPAGVAALASARISGGLYTMVAEEALRAGAEPACLIYAAGSTGGLLGGDARRVAGTLIASWYASVGRPEPPPAGVFEDAVGLAAAGNWSLARGLLAALEAAYPSYTRLLRTLGLDPLRVLQARVEHSGGWSLGLPATGYCMEARSLLNVPPSERGVTGFYDMLGEALSLCAAETRRPGLVVEAAGLNPWIPFDPVPLAAAGLQGSKGYALAAASASSVPHGLLVHVSGEEAAKLLREALGIDAPARGPGLYRALVEAWRLQLSPGRLAAIVSGNLTRLGLVSRAVSLRPYRGGLAVYYASVRLTSWLLAKQGAAGASILGGLGDTPLAPMYTVFSMPGRQLLARWALGWITGLEPPEATHGKGSGAAGTPFIKLLGSAAQGAGQLPGNLTALVSALNQTPEGRAVAQLVQQVLSAAERGDYASAADAAQRLWRMLESILGPEAARQLVLEAAKALGENPEKVAEALAAVASLKFNGRTVTVDLASASRLAGQLVEAARSAETGGAPPPEARELIKRLISAVAGAEAEAAEAAKGKPVTVVRIEGVENLVGGLKGLNVFVDLTSVLAKALGPSSGAPAAGPAKAAAPVRLPVPPPPPAPPVGAAPGWGVLLLVAAVAAGLLAYAEWRLGLLSGLVEQARLRSLESKVARGGGAVVEAFAELLRVYERRFGKRRRWETHREYASRLSGPALRPYMEAAEVYERTRFGPGAGPGDAERLRRALGEARRLLGGLLRRGGGG